MLKLSNGSQKFLVVIFWLVDDTGGQTIRLEQRSS